MLNKCITATFWNCKKPAPQTQDSRIFGSGVRPTQPWQWPSPEEQASLPLVDDHLEPQRTLASFLAIRQPRLRYNEQCILRACREETKNTILITKRKLSCSLPTTAFLIEPSRRYHFGVWCTVLPCSLNQHDFNTPVFDLQSTYFPFYCCPWIITTLNSRV